MGGVAEDPVKEAERRVADVMQAHGSSLDLASLGLISVPDSIGQLTALTSLNLSGNELTEIPDSIGQLTALTDLDLGGNPHLSSPPREVQAQGTEAVLAFLRALAESSVKRWRS